MKYIIVLFLFSATLCFGQVDIDGGTIGSGEITDEFVSGFVGGWIVDVRSFTDTVTYTVLCEAQGTLYIDPVPLIIKKARLEESGYFTIIPYMSPRLEEREVRKHRWLDDIEGCYQLIELK